MCLPSGGQLSLVIVSSFYVCSALSNTITRNSEELSNSQSRKEVKHGFKGENKIHKFLRESLIRKMQNTVFKLELQLFESLKNENFIDQKNQKDQKNSQTEMRSKFEKRSPKCLFQCLRYKHLHPAQCHYLCTMSVG